MQLCSTFFLVITIGYYLKILEISSLRLGYSMHIYDSFHRFFFIQKTKKENF